MPLNALANLLSQYFWLPFVVAFFLCVPVYDRIRPRLPLPREWGGPRVRAWFPRLVAVLVCAWPVYDFVQYALKVPKQRLIDLFVQYTAARVLAAQGDIYSFTALKQMANKIGGVNYGSAFSNLLLGYTHPPSDTFFDLRWTLFNWPDVKLLYGILTPLLFLATLLMVWDTLRRSAPRPLHWLWPVVLFALYAPVRSSLGLGQQDILILFLVALSFWALSRGHDLTAAVPIAIATLVKITPGIFVLYFLWKREWRIALYTMAATLAIVLLGLPWVGIDRWFQFVTQIFPAISTGTSYFDNQSLPGLINRLLLDPVYAQGLQSAPSVPLLRVLNTGAELLLVGAVLFLSRGRRISRRSLTHALEFSLLLLIQPIISPIAWDHYYTWLVFPVTVLLAALMSSRLSLTRATLILAALGAGLWLTNIGSQDFQRFPAAWEKSPILYGALIIFLLLGERVEGEREEANADRRQPAADSAGAQPAPI
ncbi:MAG: glycosyltransferase family 87 protein [Anaerolineae bacterium]